VPALRIHNGPPHGGIFDEQGSFRKRQTRQEMQEAFSYSFNAFLLLFSLFSWMQVIFISNDKK
jgi:hypothetical protein